VVPAVQRLRVRFAKRGRLRFASHRDFQRAFERALRRAAVPMAYSAGFTPHPKVSYLGAAATGAASEAEYLELSVTRELDPDELRASLDAALSPGLDVVDVVVATDGALAERLTASVWRIRLPQVEPSTAQAAVAAFLDRDEVTVSRRTKSGMRTFDARQPVVLLAAGAEEPAAPQASGSGTPCAILRLVVRHTTPAVRPDDVLAALREVAGLTPPVPPLVTRLAQGPLLEERATAARTAAGEGDLVEVTELVGDPFAADRTPGTPVVGS
jgi:radical SAM-linked protein